MKINSCWIKISFSSNPESFQILAAEIVNSSMVKSRDKKRLKIPKGQSESVYRRIENTMVKRKKIQKDKQRSTKHTYKTKVRVTRIPLMTGEFRCSSHCPTFNAFLHKTYYWWLVSNRWIENFEMWNSCPWHYVIITLISYSRNLQSLF